MMGLDPKKRKEILCGPGGQPNKPLDAISSAGGMQIVRDIDNLLSHGNTLCLREEAGGGKLARQYKKIWLER